MARHEVEPEDPAVRLIDARIAVLDDWRGPMPARVRALIRRAVADVVEEWKWRGVPVWSRGGILCTRATDAAVVKLTFAKGAALPDLPDCSTPASTARSGARSSCARATRWTSRRSGHSSSLPRS